MKKYFATITTVILSVFFIGCSTGHISHGRGDVSVTELQKRLKVINEDMAMAEKKGWPTKENEAARSGILKKLGKGERNGESYEGKGNARDYKKVREENNNQKREGGTALLKIKNNTKCVIKILSNPFRGLILFPGDLSENKALFDIGSHACTFYWKNTENGKSGEKTLPFEVWEGRINPLEMN